MKSTLVQLFQQMSDLTAPECANVCRVPHSCCSPEYCDMAFEEADRQGVTLERIAHPTLPLMGPTGCIAAPHLRPHCTLHTCAINGLGFKLGDLGWTKRYFKLREKIEEEKSR